MPRLIDPRSRFRSLSRSSGLPGVSIRGGSWFLDACFLHSYASIRGTGGTYRSLGVRFTLRRKYEAG